MCIKSVCKIYRGWEIQCFADSIILGRCWPITSPTPWGIRKCMEGRLVQWCGVAPIMCTVLNHQLLRAFI